MDSNHQCLASGTWSTAKPLLHSGTDPYIVNGKRRSRTPRCYPSTDFKSAYPHGCRLPHFTFSLNPKSEPQCDPLSEGYIAQADRLHGILLIPKILMFKRKHCKLLLAKNPPNHGEPSARQYTNKRIICQGKNSLFPNFFSYLIYIPFCHFYFLFAGGFSRICWVSIWVIGVRCKAFFSKKLEGS
jgi:hypothetical protein